MDRTLVLQAANLSEHMRRTDLLEKQVEANAASLPGAVDARLGHHVRRVIRWVLVLAGTGVGVVIEELIRHALKGF